MTKTGTSLRLRRNFEIHFENSFMPDNVNLNKAKIGRNDEFYTQYSDIEKEVSNYHTQFVGKWVYCPCDDHETSNFVKYFKEHFVELGLRHLTSTHIHMDGSPSERYDYDGMSETTTILSGNGDFMSNECTMLRDSSDIVVTNPPFSLFREFVDWLTERDDLKFLMIGNVQAIKYKNVFPLLKFNKMWIGCSSFNCGMWFNTPFDTKLVRVSSICWFTNMDNNKRHVPINLCEDAIEYRKYDNYDAIDVPNVKLIPHDYDGVMGVPITFIGKYNPNQFDIIDLLNRYTVMGTGDNEMVRRKHSHMCNIDGKPVFTRVLIRRRSSDV